MMEERSEDASASEAVRNPPAQRDETPSALLGEEALARVAERARQSVQQGIHGTDDNAPEEPDDPFAAEREKAIADADYARTMRGMIGLRFAAAEYGRVKSELGLMPIVWGSWALGAKRWEMEWTPEDALAAAVLSCGPRLLEVPGLVERLAGSPMAEVRRALARAVPVSAHGVLRALANDDAVEVRAAANARLADVGERGDAFPLSTEGHDESVLAPVRKILEQPHTGIVDRGRAAVRAMQPLADALAVACWERLLIPRSNAGSHVGAWLVALLSREGGGEALIRIVTAWHERGDGSNAQYYLVRIRRMPQRAKELGFTALVRHLAEPQVSPAQFDLLRSYLVACALAIVPESFDEWGLLETVLGVPVAEASGTEVAFDLTMGPLSKVLARDGLSRRVRTALLRARRSGRTGRWRRIASEVWLALGVDPVLRRRALRDLRARDATVRSRAVVSLLGEHRVPAEDGSVTKLARKLFAQRNLRMAVLDGAGKHVVADARRAILREELGVLELQRALELGAAELDGDRVWAALRRVRDRVVARGTNAPEVIAVARTLVQPGVEWDASDLELVRAAVKHAFDDEQDWRPLRLVVQALLSVEAPESEALLAELTALAVDDERRESLFHVRRMAEAQAREAKRR